MLLPSARGRPIETAEVRSARLRRPAWYAGALSSLPPEAGKPGFSSRFVATAPGRTNHAHVSSRPWTVTRSRWTRVSSRASSGQPWPNFLVIGSGRR